MSKHFKYLFYEFIINCSPYCDYSSRSVFYYEIHSAVPFVNSAVCRLLIRLRIAGEHINDFHIRDIIRPFEIGIQMHTNLITAIIRPTVCSMNAKNVIFSLGFFQYYLNRKPLNKKYRIPIEIVWFSFWNAIALSNARINAYSSPKKAACKVGGARRWCPGTKTNSNPIQV